MRGSGELARLWRRMAVAPVVLAIMGLGCGARPRASNDPYLPMAVGNSWTYLVTEPDGSKSAKVMSIVAEELVGGVGPYRDSMAFKFVSGRKFDDPLGSPSWRAKVGSRIVQYREVVVDSDTGNPQIERHWVPPRLRIDTTDEHSTLGSEWVESYTEHASPAAGVGGTPDAGAPDAGAPDAGAPTDVTEEVIIELWSVVSTNEGLTLPDGTFDTRVFRRVVQNNGKYKTYWFARGVGKVKESGANSASPDEATEELISHHLAE